MVSSEKVSIINLVILQTNPVFLQTFVIGIAFVQSRTPYVCPPCLPRTSFKLLCNTKKYGLSRSICTVQ